MNILIYQPRCSYYVGGGEVVALEQVRFLHKSGHSIKILTTKASFINESEYFEEFKRNNNRVSIEYLELDDSLVDIYSQDPGLNWKRWDLESYYVGLKARPLLASLANNQDIVIFHGVADTIAANDLEKAVLYLHGYPDTENYFQNICLHGVKNLIAVSHKIKDEWVKLANIDPKKIAVQHNGIDTSTFIPNSNARKKYDFLYIGRLIKIKGVQNIITALKKIEEKGTRTSLAIAGSGPYKEELIALTDKLKLNDRVAFLGFVDEKDKTELYNSAKVSVLPSVSREGVLTTLLESSACGVPVITTKKSSMEEFVVDGENGILVDAEIPDELSLGMLRILQDDDFRIKLGTHALATVSKGWDWNAVIENTVGMLNDMINK